MPFKPGDPFPELTITTADDQTLTLPGAFAGDFSVVLLLPGRLVPVLQRPAARLRAGQPGAGRQRDPRRRPLGGCASSPPSETTPSTGGSSRCG
jgi:hypothetical protein